jgi:hypothetical protein
MSCPYCGARVDSVYYSTTCPQCGKALHTCVSCRFYSPQSHYGCRETVDELVQDKQRQNFCDSFSLTDKKIENSDSGRQQAIDAFNSLFS